MILRGATEADLAAIDRIERASFGNPWPFDAYAQELERDVARVEVAASAGVVIAYSCTWLCGDEAHLLRIATDPSARRRGIGRDLLRAVVAAARAAGCETLSLEVAAANRPAVAMYDDAQFAVIGRRSGYYRSPPDDALIMRKWLVAIGDHPSCGDPRGGRPPRP